MSQNLQLWVILPPSFHIKLKLHKGGWIKFITASFQFRFVKEDHEYNIQTIKTPDKRKSARDHDKQKDQAASKDQFLSWLIDKQASQSVGRMQNCCNSRLHLAAAQALIASVGRWGSIEPHNFFLMGDLAFPSCSSGILCYHKQGRTQHRTWVYMYTR